MRKQAVSLPGSGSANLTGAAPPRLTPHRPVVTLALAIFLPALWLVLNGNLSVQTALVRFAGALLVSWVAAWLVFATVDHSTRSSHHLKGEAAAAPAGSLGGAGPGDQPGAVLGSTDPDGTTGLSGVDAEGRPYDAGSPSVT
jgi:hypothetical protein